DIVRDRSDKVSRPNIVLRPHYRAPLLTDRRRSDPRVTELPPRPSKARAQGAFFGRRKGHPLRTQQAVLFETLLPRLALDLAAPAPLDLTTLFPRAVEAVRLEIGFGGGEHLIAEAERAPDVGFIGVEPFVNGMGKALVAIAARELSNIRLHFADA